MRTGASAVVQVIVLASCLNLAAARVAWAHCDTLDGPVVTAARQALDRRDVTPVLKWVMPDYEEQIRAAFDKTLAVRAFGPQARDLADMYFFETLVRLHRAGEGAPYTGLEPAGTELDPAVTAADKALAEGNDEELVGLVTGTVAEGIRERFAYALETRQHADESVEAGREYVAAYVELVHYVERLHMDAVGAAGHYWEGEEGVEHHIEGHDVVEPIGPPIEIHVEE